MELGRTCDFKRATARRSTYYVAVSYADGVNQRGSGFLDTKLAVVAQERVSMTANTISGDTNSKSCACPVCHLDSHVCTRI